MSADFHTHQQTTTLHESGAITITIPIAHKRKGGRKYILTPDSKPLPYETAKINEPLLKALLRAFQWKELLESGKFANVTEIARKKQISDSYAMRIFRLTFLAPDIINAILKGRQPQYLTLLDFLQPMPTGWHEQRRKFGFPEPRQRTA